MLFPEAPHVQRWGLGLPHPRLVLKNYEKEEEMASSFLFAKHTFSGPLFLGGASSPLLPLSLCSLSCRHLQKGCSACLGPCRGPSPCVACHFSGACLLWGRKDTGACLSETRWSTWGMVLTGGGALPPRPPKWRHSSRRLCLHHSFPPQGDVCCPSPSSRAPGQDRDRD